MLKKIFITSFALCLFILGIGLPLFRTFAQTATPTPTPSSDNSSTVQALQQQISDLEGKISNLQGQEKTLSSQIQVMDSQIALTQLRIQSTQQKIMNLTMDIDTANSKIDKLQGSIDNLTKVLMNRIVATYEIGSSQPFQLLVSSSDINDFFTRANYLRIAQAHDKQLVYDTVQAKNDYTNQKQIYEDEKKQVEALNTQLQTYNNQLDQEKQQKQQLLDETQGSEANYQKLLAQTEAQLASFSNFTTVQGGASLLSNQTVCDDWGCYYNQRDSQWGSIGLGQSSYSIADDGCLLTSMAMVYTHYGHRDVTPLSINSVASNFGGIPPALLKYSVSANGVSSERVSADIDATLASGNPIIVGISYDGGPYPDHFVVFVSGSNGDYTMNDPFTPNGHNINFRGRYPTVRIVESDKVVF